MSQNNLSKVYELQWELSNPQYYPDDNAPPVPNIALATVEQNSLQFNNLEEYVSLSDRSNVPKDLADLQNFAGVPNDLGFDYRAGATQTTADHLFYSYLNVDANIPPYFLDGDEELIATYFRDFVPAACGVYNTEIPSGGNHLGYFCYPGWLRSSYAFSEKNELMFDVSGDLSSNRSRLINKSQSQPRRCDVIDIVFHILDHYSGSSRYESITSVGSDIDIMYRFDIVQISGSNRALDLTISLTDKSNENPSETLLLDKFRISRLDLEANPYILARVDLTQGSVEITGETSVGEITTTRGFTPLSYTPLFRVQEFHRLGTHDVNHSAQLIGFTRESVIPLREQYSDSIHFKKYFYQLYGDIFWFDENYEIVIPAHKGNAWSHLNKISTMFPYRRLV